MDIRPESVPGVPDSMLDPKNTWSDPDAYDQQAKKLASLFVQNFTRYPEAAPEIVAAGPIVD